MVEAKFFKNISAENICQTDLEIAKFLITFSGQPS